MVEVSPERCRGARALGRLSKAYQDAINNCSTECAPRHVAPANHKWARSLALAETILRTFKEMDPGYPRLSFDPKAIKIK
jgi:polyphosphate kinase 2 (PPK2 family)